jgi:hypothetical protein
MQGRRLLAPSASSAAAGLVDISAGGINYTVGGSQHVAVNLTVAAAGADLANITAALRDYVTGGQLAQRLVATGAAPAALRPARQRPFRMPCGRSLRRGAPAPVQQLEPASRSGRRRRGPLRPTAVLDGLLAASVPWRGWRSAEAAPMRPSAAERLAGLGVWSRTVSDRGRAQQGSGRYNARSKLPNAARAPKVGTGAEPRGRALVGLVPSSCARPDCGRKPWQGWLWRRWRWC